MDPVSDQDSHDPGPDEQKVRVQSGTTGAKMMAAEMHPQQERGAPGGSDMTTNNNSPSTNYTNTTTTATIASTTTDDRRHLINRDDFSGLQVVEAGLEVPHSHLPEALPPSDPQTQYVEYKGWDDHSPPPQAVHPNSFGAAGGGGGGGGYPFPEAVSPGGDNVNSPISQPYSKTSSATYNGGHNPFGEEKGQLPSERRIWGMRRMVFWCVLAVAVFVVVVGVAVGVGVGLGTRDDSSR